MALNLLYQRFTAVLEIKEIRVGPTRQLSDPLYYLALTAKSSESRTPMILNLTEHLGEALLHASHGLAGELEE